MEVVPISGDPGWEGEAGERPDAPPSAAANAVGHPLVLVTWRDAWFDFDGADPDARPDYLVTTVGFLVRRGPRFVSIAQEILPDGDGFRAVTHIPVAVVERMSRLDRVDDAAVEVDGTVDLADA